MLIQAMTTDRISNLPDHILHYILSFLQTIEVLRTSVLSKRWKHLWVSIPYLDFDFEPFYLARPDQERGTPLSGTFKDFVNWVLVSQNGSTKILRFELWSRNFIDKETIYRWIHVMVQRNVQELDLSICPWSMGIEFPSWLVNCNSLRVLRLNLFQCALQLPCSTGFSRLISLDLSFVELLDDDVTRSFFSSCPLLENLSLIECVLEKLEVIEISSNSLKSLTVENLEITDEDTLENLTIVVSCPNLISFKYIGPIARDYIFQNLSSLQTVFIHFIDSTSRESWEEVGYLTCKMLSGLRGMHALKLSVVFIEFMYVVLGKPGGFSLPLYSLKSLKLCAGVDPHYMKIILHLLKYTPHLEALLIQFIETCEWHDDCPLEDEAMPCLAHHLRIVELIDFQGKENEIELVRFILKNAQVLEKLVITWYSFPKNLREITKKIKEFPKSSSSVAVKFCRPKLEEVDFFLL